MKISCDFDIRPLIEKLGGEPGSLEGLDARVKRRFTYATVNAINWTALYVQRDAAHNVERNFTIRSAPTRKLLREQGAIIEPFANVSAQRFYAEVKVGDKARLAGSPLLLPEFERGAKKRPVTPGAKRVAVPITENVRGHFAGQIPKSLQIKNLKLKPRFSKSVARNVSKLRRTIRDKQKRAAFTKTIGAGQVWQGAERTYMIPQSGIYQRIGRGKTRVLYSFDSDVGLPPQLGFLELAQRQGRQILRRELERHVGLVASGRQSPKPPRRL